MMSIHAAKGLEFPVVFVSALHKGPRNDTQPLLFSPELALGVRWRNPVTGKAVSDTAHARLDAEWKSKEKAEANRLLYVAMTRAEDLLILSEADSQRPTPWMKLARTAIKDQTVAAAPPAMVPVGPATVEVTEGRLLDRPVLAGQYDSSAPVTSVAMFHACPRKYYLSRYLGLEPEPEGPGTGAIELGLEVHRALAGEPVDSAEALELKARFEASDLGRRAARATRIEREFDFQLECEDVILRGQIDLWFEEAGALVLVDYKTDRDESGHDAYALQLRLYALALEHYAGRVPDRAVLYYLRPNRAVNIELTDSQLREAQGVVRALRDAQETLVFPLKEGEQCKRCSFYAGLCPAGRATS
jgi:CRISPR-associated protein Cas4